jgi:hypothetical protein
MIWRGFYLKFWKTIPFRKKKYDKRNDEIRDQRKIFMKCRYTLSVTVEYMYMKIKRVPYPEQTWYMYDTCTLKDWIYHVCDLERQFIFHSDNMIFIFLVFIKRFYSPAVHSSRLIVHLTRHACAQTSSCRVMSAVVCSAVEEWPPLVASSFTAYT